MEFVHVVDDYLIAVVTYYKKGDTKKVGALQIHTLHVIDVCTAVIWLLTVIPKVDKKIKPATENQYKIHEIVGRDLKPSTTYVVSVRSYENSSKRLSDPSNEREFTTRKSSLEQIGSAL